MEQENLAAEVEQKSPVNQVTPLSKYLALALFVTLPFLGGWIGYEYAPEKIIMIETVVVKEPKALSANTEVNTVATNLENLQLEKRFWQSICEEGIQKRFLINDENVYYENKIISGADLETFLVIPTPPAPCEEVYAMDATQVFYKDKVILGANPNKFRIYDSEWLGWRVLGPYSRDDKNVYYEDRRIYEADTKSFTAFYEGKYASDDNAVYLDGVIVEGADPKTFSFPVFE